MATTQTYTDVGTAFHHVLELEARLNYLICHIVFYSSVT